MNQLVPVVPLCAQDVVAKKIHITKGKSWMSTFDRIFHVQTRMFVIPPSSRCCHCANVNIVGLHKYSSTVYEACIASFNCLPVSALVDRKFLCVHGGISPDLHTLKDIEDVCSPMLHSISVRLMRSETDGSLQRTWFTWVTMWFTMGGSYIMLWNWTRVCSSWDHVCTEFE